MKHFSFFLFFALLLSICSFSQPSLNQNNGYQEGTTVELYYKINPELSEGSSGTNQTWDFSSLASSDPALIFNGVAVSSTPYSADFPGATISSTGVDLEGNEVYNYFTNNGSQYSNLGFETNTQKFIFSNPMDILHYPIHYGDSFSDSYYAALPMGSESGMVEESADAYGNIILPTGIFYNCLRIREVRKDTLDGDLILTTSNDTSYKFYVVNYPEPVCQVNHHHNSNGYNLNEIYWQNAEPSAITVLHNDETVSLFPNPCRDFVQVSFHFSDESMIVGIVDISGRKFFPDQHFENQMLVMNTSMREDGAYFLIIETRQRKMFVPFVKMND